VKIYDWLLLEAEQLLLCHSCSCRPLDTASLFMGRHLNSCLVQN